MQETTTGGIMFGAIVEKYSCSGPIVEKYSVATQIVMGGVTGW